MFPSAWGKGRPRHHLGTQVLIYIHGLEGVIGVPYVLVRSEGSTRAEGLETAPQPGIMLWFLSNAITQGD